MLNTLADQFLSRRRTREETRAQSVETLVEKDSSSAAISNATSQETNRGPTRHVRLLRPQRYYLILEIIIRIKKLFF